MQLPPVRLSDAARDAGYRLATFDMIGSTNDEGLARARAGDPGRLWLVADGQSQGRGRSGRSWASLPGNLLASLLLRAPCPAAVSPQIGFVAGVALHQAVADVAGVGAGRLAIKWPNDLLLDGAKLAGILVEGTTVSGLAGGTERAVVVGFGVNLTAYPADTPYPATDFRAAGLQVGRPALFAALAETMAHRLAVWQEGRGFAAIRRDWLARAGGLGAPIVVRHPNGETRGVFRDLDPEGRLLLENEGAIIVIQAGDVFPAEAGMIADRNKDATNGR